MKRGQRLLPLHTGTNHFRRVSSPLNGYLGDAGQRFSFFIRGERKITNDKYFGIVWHGKVRVDLNAPAAVRSSMSTFRKLLSKCIGRDAPGPEDGLSGKMLRGFPSFVLDPFRIDVRNHHALDHFYSQARHQFLGFCRQVFGIRGEHSRPAFHQKDASLLRFDVAKIVPQRLLGDFRERSGEFHSRGACAHNHKREPRARLFFALGTFGAFKSIENLVPDGRGFLDGLEAGGPFAPGIISIIGSLRTGGHDQRVVFERRAIPQDHAPRLRIDVRRFAQQNLRVLLAAQYSTQGRGDIPRRQRARGYLVKQRLKQMKIAPVDKRHVDRGALEFLRGVQSSESAAQNHNAMPLCHSQTPCRTI